MTNNNSFLGMGWSFPPKFNRDVGGIETVFDEEDIHQSLEILFSTRPGERLMQPDFGCELSQFLFEEVSQSLITAIRGIISDAIISHEPRIKLNNVDISESETTSGLLLISIDYTIRSTNSRFNLVYPFYVNEATII